MINDKIIYDLIGVMLKYRFNSITTKSSNAVTVVSVLSLWAAFACSWSLPAAAENIQRAEVKPTVWKQWKVSAAVTICASHAPFYHLLTSCLEGTWPSLHSLFQPTSQPVSIHILSCLSSYMLLRHWRTACNHICAGCIPLCKVKNLQKINTRVTIKQALAWLPMLG